MSDTIHQAKQKDPNASTQLYMRIAEIRDDTIVLKNGGLRAVLTVGSINVNLKSEEEQNSLAAAYQNFLNSLEFPVQVIVRSKKLDISNYLSKLKTIGKNQKNELLRNQVFEYTEYIRKLVEFADIMEKQFYVVIPYDPVRTKSASIFGQFWDYIHPADSVTAFQKRQKEFGRIVKALNQHVESVKSNLENCGLTVSQMPTAELIEMFYGIYNPLTARQQQIHNPAEHDLQIKSTDLAQPIIRPTNQPAQPTPAQS